MPKSPTSPMNPDVVSEIVAKARATGRGGRLDLQTFQRELHRIQRAKRVGGFEQALTKMQRRKHRLRVRHPKIADCKVVDTRANASKTRLYFELSNGQAVRADRVDDRSVTVREPNLDLVVRKGRRKAPFKNNLIRQKVSAEILANAAREEAAA